MRKVWAVVRREFVERVRSRWFWIMALVGPLFMRTFLLFAPVTDAYLTTHVDFLLAGLRTSPPPKPAAGRTTLAQASGSAPARSSLRGLDDVDSELS